MSLSAMLDSNPEGSNDDDGSDSEGDEASESEDSKSNDDVDALAPSDSENEGEDALAKLDTFIDGLSTTASAKKRKAADDGADGVDGGDVSGQRASRKRRILPEKTEAGAENEFAPTRGASGKSLVFILVKKMILLIRSTVPLPTIRR